MRKKLQDYLPPILLKTYEFPLLCETEQPEIDRLHDAADAVLDAQFLSTAGEYAISRGTRRSSALCRRTPTRSDERRFKRADQDQHAAAVFCAPPAAAACDTLRRGWVQAGGGAAANTH